MANGLDARLAKLEQANMRPAGLVLWRREHQGETDGQVIARWRALNPRGPKQFTVNVIRRPIVDPLPRTNVELPRGDATQ